MGSLAERPGSLDRQYSCRADLLHCTLVSGVNPSCVAAILVAEVMADSCCGLAAA